MSLDRIGVAVAISELSGLLSPLTGSMAERIHRRTSMWAGCVGVALGASLAAGGQTWSMFAVALVVLARARWCSTSASARG